MHFTCSLILECGIRWRELLPVRAVQGGAALPGVRLSWSQRGEVVKISEMGVLILLTHVGFVFCFLKDT